MELHKRLEEYNVAYTRDAVNLPQLKAELTPFVNAICERKRERIMRRLTEGEASSPAEYTTYFNLVRVLEELVEDKKLTIPKK